MAIEEIVDADTLDIFLCLNQGLVGIDRISDREFCRRCLKTVRWTQSAAAGYLLWDSNFITGRWDCKRPEIAQSAYNYSEIEYHYQRLVMHPMKQACRFMEEAAAKFKMCRCKLEQFYSKEALSQIETSFVEILDFLNYLNKVLPKYEGAGCSNYTVTHKGLSVTRRLCYKVKKLINIFQPVLDKHSAPGQRYNLLDHHLPLLHIQQSTHKKYDSNDSEDSDTII